MTLSPTDVSGAQCLCEEDGGSEMCHRGQTQKLKGQMLCSSQTGGGITGGGGRPTSGMPLQASSLLKVGAQEHSNTAHRHT